MMQFKENKNLVILFRLCIFAAFFTGLMYFVKFVSAPASSSAEKAIAGLVGFFYAYLVFTVVSFVFSILCFKTTSKVSSVVRTIFLGAISIVLFLNISLIRVMSAAIQVESGNYDNYDQLIKLNEKAEKMADNTAAYGTTFLLSFASVLVMLILAITSVVALVKTLKGKAGTGNAT